MPPTFAELGVPEQICSALAQRGIITAFEIQAATLTDTLAGRDVCGRAPTGSGKTLAFGIPLVVSVERAQPKRPRALVLAPTRELAEQITEEIRSFAGDVRVGAVYGGVGYEPQLRALRSGIDILVACPGRLEDLISQRHVSLADVDRVVLDEADRMADMGFMPAVKRLLDQTSDNRQTVLFSATLDGDVAKITRSYQNDPVRHEVGDETPDVTSAHHVFWKVDTDSRTATTVEVANAVWPAIIFCRTRHGSDRLAKRLAKSGVSAVAIHGGRSQRQRARALSDFSGGRAQALVATDVAARGIHVDGVACVIHYDPPADHKDYVHRSGRTARAGEGGVVVSFVASNQEKDLKRMQRQVGISEPITSPDAGQLRQLALGNIPDRPAPPVIEEREERNDRSASRGQSDRKQQARAKNRSKPRTRRTSGGPRREENDSNRGERSRKRDGAKSSSGSGNGSTRSRSNSKKSSSTSRSRTGSKSRHAAQQSTKANNGGPNRKARRAHLQPSSSERRSA